MGATPFAKVDLFMMARALVLFVLFTTSIARSGDAQNKIDVIRGDAPKEGVAPVRNRHQLGIELEDAVRTITGQSEQLVIHSDGRTGLRVVVLGKVSKDKTPKVVEAIRTRVIDSNAEHMHLIFIANVNDPASRQLISDVEQGGDLPCGVYLSLRERLDE